VFVARSRLDRARRSFASTVKHQPNFRVLFTKRVGGHDKLDLNRYNVSRSIGYFDPKVCR